MSEWGFVQWGYVQWGYVRVGFCPGFVYYTDQSHSVTQAHQVCVCCIGVFDVNRFTFNEGGLCICLLI